MKFALLVYQMYFQVSLKLCPREQYFLAFLDPEKGRNRFSVIFSRRFLAIFSRLFSCVTMISVLQAYWSYFQLCNHGSKGQRRRSFLTPNLPKYGKIQLLTIPVKYFFCATIKLGLTAYQMYFQQCISHGTPGAIFSDIFCPRKGPK